MAYSKIKIIINSCTSRLITLSRMAPSWAASLLSLALILFLVVVSRIDNVVCNSVTAAVAVVLCCCTVFCSSLTKEAWAAVVARRVAWWSPTVVWRATRVAVCAVVRSVTSRAWLAFCWATVVVSSAS